MAKRKRVLGRGGAILAVAVAAALALLPGTGAAQVPPIPPIEHTPAPAPSPPGAPNPSPSPSPTPTPTTAPSPRQPAPSPSPSPAAPAPPPSGDGSPTPFEGSPEEGLAYWASLPKSPPSSTLRLLELLQRLEPPGRPLTAEAIVRGVGRFPVAGFVWYQDDWAAPRYVPYFHLHEGTDLFAEAGTPVVAPRDGVIAKLAVGSIGGISIWLDADDDVTYYFGHLRAYAPGLQAGQRVRTGEVIGSVGDSGDAQGTYPHVHFEVHPLSGPPVSPKPILDRWLTLAEERATRLLRLRSEDVLAISGAARWGRLIELLAEPGVAHPPLWPSVLDPAGSTAAFADLALARLAAMTDARAPWESGAVFGVEGAAPWSDPLALLERAARPSPLVAGPRL